MIEDVIQPRQDMFELQLSFDGFKGSERKLVNNSPVAETVYENILYTLNKGVRLQIVVLSMIVISITSMIHIAV